MKKDFEMKVQNKKYGKKKLLLIIFLISIGVFSSIICNEKAIMAYSENDGLTFPAIKEMVFDWIPYENNSLTDKPKYSFAIYPPIPYSYDFIDAKSKGYNPPNTRSGRLYKTHWLGTDILGRDVLAGLIRGTQTALKVAFISSFLSLLFGSLLGFMAAHYKNHLLKSTWPQIASFAVFILLFLYLIFEAVFVGWFSLFSTWPLLILMSAALVGMWYKLPSRLISIPIDNIILRFIEFRKSISTLIILLAILPILSKPSLSSIVLILILIGWPSFAKYARAEGLKIKEEGYFKAAEASGVGFYLLLRNHFWPNAKNTLLMIFAFVLVGNILIESSLSFLGIGLPATEVSWGSMINDGRQNISAWWLSVFPGLMIFIVVYVINKLRVSLEE